MELYCQPHQRQNVTVTKNTFYFLRSNLIHKLFWAILKRFKEMVFSDISAVI